ncbi:MAG TPA: efflux RND transporter periplasmic adaptor subunit [Acidobacteriaceae bacterium]|nr:efflux RND transporter periplasmic adaptor subunit [Acidobacteriaceae bacterium]
MTRSASTHHAWAFRALCALPFALIFAAGCHSADNPDNAANALPIAPIAVASRAPLSNTLNVAGEFLPFQEVELHAKVAGYIRHISVDIGDRVRSGEVLATLDIPELTAQVEGADANVLETQEQITRAKSEVLRARADYDAVHSAAQRLQQVSMQRPGLIAQQELDDALAKDRAAAAQVDAAKSAQSAVQQQLGVSRAGRQQVSAMADYSRIVAPFNGIVTWRYADTGSLIQAGTSNAGSAPVVKIAEIDTLRLRLPVPESLAPFVHDGDTASVHVQALNETFPGKITRSAGELDPTTRTMQVEIDVPNPGDKLDPGMYADVTLNISRTGNALVVPIQAVDQTGPQPFVMLVNSSNQVEKRAVTIGVSTANQVEITRGLIDGDKVIVANLASFQPGEKVAPQTSSMVHLGTSGGDD